MSISYDGLKKLGKRLRRNMPELLVLKDENDPFYADVPRRRERAEWFARLWDQFGFSAGTHLRRVHYRVISQATPILLPDGEPYQNTEGCWRKLIWGGRDARYLHLVPMADFIDQRNSETVVKLSEEEEKEAAIYLDGRDSTVSLPELPSLWLSRPTVLQRYHLEIIAEKTTADDILMPLGEEYGLNVTSCAGDISLTRCFEVIQRAKASQRPVRVLYVSDFDPRGREMPVAAARKLEFLIRDGNLDLDLQLRQVALTEEQCQEYRLPRTPIKDGEQSEDWVNRYGAGATELDAMEALHPGELRRILVAEIERYFDAVLLHRVRAVAAEIDDIIENANAIVHAQHERQIEALRSEIRDLNERIGFLYQGMETDLRAKAPDIDDIHWPEPVEGDDDPDPLFSGSREYVEQVDRFKRHLNKPVRPPDPVMAAMKAEGRAA